MGEVEVYSFTDREIQVLFLLCAGKINKEIAWLLGISKHNVKKRIEAMAHFVAEAGRNTLIIWCFTHSDQFGALPDLSTVSPECAAAIRKGHENLRSQRAA